MVIRRLENLKFGLIIKTENISIKVQNLNCRQVCQTLYLLRFDFTLKYVLRTKMRKTNNLDRRPDQKVEIEKDNENQKLIKKKQIQDLIKVVIEELEVNIIERN